ncbi:related to Double Strand Break repair protein mus-11 [Cephalotrichum gorgonifer]|uniref:Tethering factor for nuclear proteasome STS1 n=1 Tax=Cephalotrichum gorgonifer TaxID=2041049 RepID=A0AAE8MQ86_9PEZI|nr:related to Double Strand Break repair protein mus-11 [Cephalotrichum gorgonifer]
MPGLFTNPDPFAVSPYTATMNSRKRRFDDDGDEMAVSPNTSPALPARQLARPSKKIRSNDVVGKPLSLNRLLETLDATQLRMVLEKICEHHPAIGQEVANGAPRPTVTSALDVLSDYQAKLKAAIPYGNPSTEYAYYRVRQPLIALLEALSEFTPQYLPPTETQTSASLQFLDGATKVIHALPDWDSQSHRHHKENAYEEIAMAWALVISEAAKRGGGFVLHSGGWDQRLAKHNEQSGNRLQAAVNAMNASVGWIGTPHGVGQGSSADPASIRNQLMSGTPGDQHLGNAANPFDEIRPRISEYTAQQIATLQSRLEKQLGPEYISSRAGPGGQKVHYIAAEKCIALANEVFGFNGWSSAIQNITMDFVDEHPQTMRVSLGLSVIVRVTLRDGTYHEDLGYGHIENCKGKAAAFEKAKKEGTTDALKRALKNFGNVLGNCLYDKEYLGKVTRMKVAPTKFNEANLHRHPDYATKKEEKEEVKLPVVKEEPLGAGDLDLFSDDFGDLDDSDFTLVEQGHPDEVTLPTTTTTTNNSLGQAPSGRVTAPPVNKPPQTPNNVSRHVGQAPGPAMAGRQPGPQGQTVPPPQYRPNSPALNAPNVSATRPSGPGPTEPAGFFSARAINKDIPVSSLVTEVLVPKAQQLFNPKAESPSIRKTPGIDHNSSKPIPRSAINPDSNSTGPQPSHPRVESPSIRKTPGIDHNSSKPILRSAVQPQPSYSGSQSGPAQGTGMGMGMGMGARPPGGGFQAGRGNVVNPHLDQARRIGAPGSGGSPLSNRGQYRPPTMKRPLPGEGAAPAAVQPVLGDVSTNVVVTANHGSQGEADVKRQKIV